MFVEEKLLNEVPEEAGEAMHLDWPDDRFRELTQGQIIEAKVILVRDDAAFVDIGGKSDLTIPVEELAAKPAGSAKEMVKPGDIIKVMVTRTGDDDKILLSKRLVDQEQIWFDLEASFKQGTPVSGKVTGSVKGGLNVDVGGLKAFMPASQATLGASKSLDDLVGQVFPVNILEFDRSKRRILVSRRELLAAEKKRATDAFFSAIKEGDRKTGTVTRLTDFGAFVDLGSGIEGLIHISELSWQRVKTAKEILNEGDQVEVLITKIDPATKKISLSLKQIQPHPWDEGAEKFKEGGVFPGTVVRLETFGAFVRLAPGIEGLVHISQIADKRIGKPDEVLKVGDEVQARVLSIDKANRKVSLSLREPAAATKEPAEAPKKELSETEQYLEAQPVGNITQNLGALMNFKPGNESK